ncbi:hypothetical protein MKX01_011098 [Papaver californicum]|nr:hypothetical protein MKX01_011098 [Papaver californicum]
MLKVMLGCCKAYISESQNRAVLEPSEKAKELYRGVAVVNKFEDEAYNRTLHNTELYSSSTAGSRLIKFSDQVIKTKDQ